MKLYGSREEEKREATQSEQHGHEQHRAQSTEHRAPGGNENKGRGAARGAARVGICKYKYKQTPVAGTGTSRQSRK